MINASSLKLLPIFVDLVILNPTITVILMAKFNPTITVHWVPYITEVHDAIKKSFW